MKIGVIGAGGIAGAFAHQAVKAGNEVVISNSRGPESLTSVVNELGSLASAGTVLDSAANDIVFVAVPWSKIPSALKGVSDWSGKIVIDANNPIEAPEFKVAELGGRTSSEIVAELVPGADVVKAFNTLPVPVLRSDPRTTDGRRVIFISGDSELAKKVVVELIDQMGFAAVDLGDLQTGGAMQQFPTGPLPVLNLIKVG